MFLSPSKHENAHARKQVKGRSSIVNLFHRRFHQSPTSAIPESMQERETTTLPTHPTRRAPSVRTKNNNDHGIFSRPAQGPRPPRATASMGELGSSGLDADQDADPEQRPAHRRSQSANSPTYANPPSYTYNDLFKTDGNLLVVSGSAVERKIWPGQHRYSQEIRPMEFPESPVDPFK